MKCLLRAPALLFSLTLFSMNAGFAADYTASPGDATALANQAGKPTAAEALAAEVGEIAHFRMMSHAKKEKRIANAMRVAVTGATAYKDPAETLNIASELAAAAATAAPPFKDAIVHAVLFTPSVASIDGASGQIQAAVDYAAAKAVDAEKAAKVENQAVPAGAENAPPVAPAETVAATQDQTPAAPLEKATMDQPAETVPPPSNVENTAGASTAENGASQDRTTPWTLPKIDLGENASLHFTADLNARYDDNVFLTKTNKVSDEILSATPGVVFQFGQNSLANGSFSYQESFLNYVHKSSSAQQLGTGLGNLGYSNDRVDLKANADYVQSSQNQEGFFIAGQRTVVRRDQLDVGSSQEVHLTEKLGAGVGESYSRAHYRTPGFGLIDNNSSSFPVNVYYAIRPKVDLSAGFTQSEIKTPGQGPGSTQVNRYYNIGARGEFTPKLTGGFSVGYTTSTITQSGRTHLFSFDGNFGYELSPKTALTLTGSRDFSAGAQGEQLKNTSIVLAASTDFSAQWQGGLSLNYQNIGYPGNRTDNYLEGDMSATYIYSQNLNATIKYSLRNNTSNVSTAEFLDNILSLNIGLRY